MKLKLLYISILFILPIIGKGQVVYNAEVEMKIDSLFQEYEGEAGAAAAIYHNGQVLYQKGFGYANLENEIKVSPHTVFETGAVAMHVTATAILLLEKDGKLNLDDVIQKYLTTFPQYEKGEVTINHCLHQSSGLRDYLDLIKMTGRSQHIDFDNEAGFDLLQKQKALTINPGSDFRYSHSNYLALALIVEKVSGKSIGEYAKENIFAPLGMNNTFYYEDNEKVIKNRALLYGQEGEEYKLKQNFDFTACGDGRLYSTVEDMAKWMANFNSSKIGGDKKFMKKLLNRGVLNNGDEMSYAMGLEYGTVNGREDIGHNGWFGGATAMILYTPSADFAVVTMGNNIDKSAIGKAFRINSLCFDDANYVSKEEKSETPVSTTKMSTKEKEKFCGAYFSYDIGYDYRVYLKDGELYFNDGENDHTMIKPIGDDKFMVMDGINWTILTFGNDGSEKVMYYQYSQRPPVTLLAFEPVVLSEEDLKQFTGKYHSEELDVMYDLKINGEKLQVFLGEKKIVEFDPLMSDLFNSEHDGYLKFEKGSNGEFNKFTINDYSLGEFEVYQTVGECSNQ